MNISTDIICASVDLPTEVVMIIQLQTEFYEKIYNNSKLLFTYYESDKMDTTIRSFSSMTRIIRQILSSEIKEELQALVYFINCVKTDVNMETLCNIVMGTIRNKQII